MHEAPRDRNYAGYLVGALLLARVQPGAATRLEHYLLVDHRQPGAAGLGELVLDHYYAARRRWRAERDNADCRFAVAAGTYGASSRGAVAVCRVGLGIFISAEGIALGHARSLTSQQISAAQRIMRRSAAGAGDPLAADSPAALVRVSMLKPPRLRPGATSRAAWRL